MDTILNWIYADYWRVNVVRFAFAIGGAIIVVCGLLLLIWRKRKLGIWSWGRSVESDRRALQVLIVLIPCIAILGGALTGYYDWVGTYCGINTWLALTGIVVSIRSRQWKYLWAILAVWLLIGAWAPAT